jgi:hypothetical protein
MTHNAAVREHQLRTPAKAGLLNQSQQLHDPFQL